MTTQTSKRPTFQQWLAMLATERPVAELRAAGFTVAEFLATGFTVAELRAAWFTAAEFLATGFTVAELRAAWFTAAEFLATAGFTATELRAAGFTATELRAAGFTADTLRSLGFTAAELRAAGFTVAELRAAGFTATEFLATGFTVAELRAAGFTPAELRAAWFTPEEFRAAEEEWDSIPIITKLYTRLLADIEAGRRKHDQSDFGPDRDPGENLCKTPMCTAGHLVNMAGEVGYAIQRKYDWAGAARMIHMKNRPDAPPQNYGAIPQKLAMAYIRERAAEEEAFVPST